MKYLKSFNEALLSVDERAELQNFCEEYLIDLIDDGFNVIVGNEYHLSLSRIYITHFIDSKLVNFQWNDVKDKMINFMNILNDNYKVGKIIFSGIDANFVVTISEQSAKKIINDRVDDVILGRIIITVGIKPNKPSLSNRILKFFRT